MLTSSLCYSTAEDIPALREIESFYNSECLANRNINIPGHGADLCALLSAQIDEMPMNVADLI